MKGRMLVVAPGRRVPMGREYTAPIPIEDLHAAVGGYIEIVPYFQKITIDGESHRCIVYCNEDGKRLPLARNIEADVLWDLSLEGTGASRVQGGVELDYLVGSIAIVFGDDEFMEAL